MGSFVLYEMRKWRDTAINIFQAQAPLGILFQIIDTSKKPDLWSVFVPPLVCCSHKSVCFEDICYRLIKYGHVIRSKLFFLKYHFGVKRKRCGGWDPPHAIRTLNFFLHAKF